MVLEHPMLCMRRARESTKGGEYKEYIKYEMPTVSLAVKLGV